MFSVLCALFASGELYNTCNVCERPDLQIVCSITTIASPEDLQTEDPATICFTHFTLIGHWDRTSGSQLYSITLNFEHCFEH